MLEQLGSHRSRFEQLWLEAYAAIDRVLELADQQDAHGYADALREAARIMCVAVSEMYGTESFWAALAEISGADLTEGAVHPEIDDYLQEALDILRNVERLAALESELLITVGVPRRPAEDYGAWAAEALQNWEANPRLPAVWGIHGALGLARDSVCHAADHLAREMMIGLPDVDEAHSLTMYFSGRRGLGRGLVWLGGGAGISFNAALFAAPEPILTKGGAVASVIGSLLAWGAQLQYDADH